MSELISSFLKWLNEKTSSPLYFTYLISFVMWNWKFFQIIFLEDANLFYLPRVEYLNSLFITPSDNVILNWFVNFILFVVPPVLFTFLAIKYLPILQKWAFELHITYYFKRKEFFQERKVEYEKKMANLTKQEVIAKKERIEQEKIIEITKTQEEKWQEELKQIKRQDLLYEFQKLVGVIYETGGVSYSHQIENRLPRMSVIMAFADAYDLISIEKLENSSPLIQLTDKGKYFSRILTDKGIIAR